MIIKMSNVNKEYKEKIPRGFFKDIFLPKYQTVKAIDSISIEVEEGDFVGLLGKNGAGKSTFIKLLCALQMPTSGRVELFGRESSSYSNDLFNKVAVIFGHKSSLWWDLPLIDSINATKFMYKIEGAEFELRKSHILGALDLGNVINRPVRILSLGERVKGELAFNLMHKPKLVLLDEPTIGLDIVSKSRLREFLKELVEKEHAAVILTSHDMGDIEYCCQRICVIDKGNIKFNGSLDEFRAHINLESIITLSFKSNFIEPEKLYGLREIDGVNEVEWHEEMFSSRISFQPKQLSSDQLISKIHSLNLSVDSFSVVERQASFEQAVRANFEE